MAKKMTAVSGRAGTLLLDAEIYTAQAVKLAAFVLSGRAEIKIKPAKKALSITVSGGDGRAAGEFMNEVLNQQCRIDLAKKNSRIAGIIATKALLSAAGGR